MGLRIQPLTYKTAHSFGAADQIGYAIEMPAARRWLHLCVRSAGNMWLVDHYESGYLVPHICEATRAAAVAEARAWRPSAASLKQMRDFFGVAP